MSQGFSFQSFAGEIGVSAKTLHDWAHRYPDFGEAKFQAEVKSLRAWEQLGMDGMLGKIKGFNATVYIFSMKARFAKYGWRDLPENLKSEESVEENRFRSELAQMSREELTQMVEKELSQLKAK